MNKPQKTIVIFFVITALIIASLVQVYFYKQKNADNSETNDTIGYKITGLNPGIIFPSEITFYYGSTCPHCKIVEEFIKNNSLESKIKISQIEVYGNETAAKEMVSLQKLTSIPANYVGAVPLLYYNRTLYLGDVDIISILKDLTGVK